MQRVVFVLLAFVGASSVFAESPTKVCEQSAEAAALFPDYKSSPDTPAKLLSVAPIFILSQRPGTTACVALALDETGVPQDATAFPSRANRLSKGNRKTLLSHRFSPALADGKPVRSIEF